MSNSNDFVNSVLRGAAGRLDQTSAPGGAGQGKSAGITTRQEERIDFYVSNTGCSYREARDLILGEPEAKHSPPVGNAGSGTGAPPSPGFDMNQMLRNMAGQFRWPW